MKKLILLAVLIVAGAAASFIYSRRNQAPEIPFARVVRQTLVSTLNTNGKVEPLRWEEVRAQVAGTVSAVPVHQGDNVAQGQDLATLDVPELQAEVQAAQARVVQAQADLATIEAGGKASDLADIDGQIARYKVDKEEAQREYESLQRLAEKQAATAVEVAAARSKVRQAELHIQALERRRMALVASRDRTVARARLRDAESALALARGRVADATIRAPLRGVVYNLPIRPGSYLKPGDLAAEVGQVDRLRLHIYVDEPELGRVAVGQAVTVTWEALPGKSWKGTVEKLPSQVVALGTRQVGDVLATLDNPHRELVPGTNVNVEIRTADVPNAVTIPKTALRRETSGFGVYRLTAGDSIEWRPVETGASSIMRVQILRGLAEGDSVVLPTDVPLTPGDKVRPVYPEPLASSR